MKFSSIKAFLFFALILLIGSGGFYAHGQVANENDVDPMAEVKAKCKTYRKVPLPPEVANVTVPPQWPECHSYQLYRGLHMKKDHTAALQCAAEERAASLHKLHSKDDLDILGGSALLSELYANGDGVPRNFTLAARFLCEQADTLDSDYGIRVDVALADLEYGRRNPHARPEAFDLTELCGMSSLQMNMCTQWSTRIDHFSFLDKGEALAVSWPDAQKNAFQNLLNTEEAYVPSAAWEVASVNSTLAPAFASVERESEHAKFLAAIKSFERGKFPSGTTKKSVAAERTLNLAYRAAIEVAKKPHVSHITPGQIHDAQNLWFKYRDSFIEFVALRYPGVESSAWRTMLTRKRTVQLQSLYCSIMPEDNELNAKINRQCNPTPP